VTLVDTNVLLDLVTNDSTWADWSVEQLETASLAGPLLINDVVYAELAVRYERIEELDAFIDEAGLVVAPIPRAALFLAGEVFTRYRRAGGSRTGVGFDRWRPRRGSTAPAVNARCRSVPILFPNCRVDHTGSMSQAHGSEGTTRLRLGEPK
jgi:predicted nucleic acid-binding protein